MTRRTFQSISATPWTDFLAARQSPELRARCLEMFAEKYREPICAYIRCALGVRRPDEVEDLTQAYFCRFLQRGHFDILDPEAGRLRSWLMKTVRNFVNDERRKRRRGGGVLADDHPQVRDDDVPVHGGAAPTPEDELNRRWALEIHADAIRAFRRYCDDKGKRTHFLVFERHALADADRPDYETTAAELNISVKDVANYLSRSKAKFADIYRAVIRGTVSSDEEAEREERDLLRYFHP